MADWMRPQRTDPQLDKQQREIYVLIPKEIN